MTPAAPTSQSPALAPASASSTTMKALTLSATWAPKAGYRLSDDERAARRAGRASAAWRNPTLQFGDVPVPRIEPDELLVRVRSCGVCGSDAHCCESGPDGYVLFSGPAKLPVILGHEFAGDVVEVGKRVSTLRVGDAVTAESVQWCGVCTPCRSGNPNQCERGELLGFTAPGAFAPYVAVNQRHCWKIDTLRDALAGDDEQVYDVAALIEPIGCAYNGLFIAGGGFRPGAYVSIYGAGPIGLAALLMARAAGAAKVFVFDISSRNALAMTLGADYVANPIELKRQGTSAGEVVRDLTGGHGADMQVEAAGAAAETMPEIAKSFAPNGRMVYLGRADNGATVEFDTLVTQANQIAGSRGHAGHGIFPSVIRLLATGRVPAHQMITSRFPLDRATDAVAHAAMRTEGKIIVRCS